MVVILWFSGYAVLFKASSLYQYVLVNVCVAVLRCDREEYGKVEVMLLRNVLDGGKWNSLLAVDVWSTALR